MLPSSAVSRRSPLPVVTRVHTFCIKSLWLYAFLLMQYIGSAESLAFLPIKQKETASIKHPDSTPPLSALHSVCLRYGLEFFRKYWNIWSLSVVNRFRTVTRLYHTTLLLHAYCAVTHTHTVCSTYLYNNRLWIMFSFLTSKCHSEWLAFCETFWEYQKQRPSFWNNYIISEHVSRRTAQLYTLSNQLYIISVWRD